MSTAREVVLNRVKAANAAAGHPNPVPIPRDYHRSGTLAAGSRELLDLLVDRLVDYKATVVESAPDEIPSAIAGALTGAGVTGRVLVPPRDLGVAPSGGALRGLGGGGSIAAPWPGPWAAGQSWMDS